MSSERTNDLYVVVTEDVVANDNRLAPLLGRRVGLREYSANRWGRCIVSGKPFQVGAKIGYARLNENGQNFYLTVLLETSSQSLPNRSNRSTRVYNHPKPAGSNQEYRIPDEKISEHQEEATNLFLTCFDNLILESRAGGGKTTMLKHLASFRSEGKNYYYLVFNSKNAKEIRGKMPLGCRSSTTHSFLGRVIEDHFQRSEFVKDKHAIILNDIYPLLNNDRRRVIRRSTLKMVGLAKNFAVRPGDIDRIVEVLSQYDFDLEEEEYTQAVELCNEVLELSLPTSRYGSIWSHDDTLWWPIMYDMPMPYYHVVLIDEVQDFNLCQILMVSKMLDAGCRIVAVGDPHQSLYRFRGADGKAFEKMCNLLYESERGAKKVILPINYRSGSEIIEYVKENTHVKDIQARPGAPKGKVVLDYNYNMVLDMLSH